MRATLPVSVAAVPKRKAGIVADTLAVSVLAMAAKVGGAGKSIAIARVFGSGAALDAYLLAFLIPSFAIDVFCGSLVPVLVPAFVEWENRNGRVKAMLLYANVQRSCLKYSLAGALLMVTGAVTVGSLSGASDNFRFTTGMVLVMAPIVPLAALANVWRAVLNARHRFVVPAAGAVVVPLVLVASVLSAGSALGIWVLAWATTAAVVAEVAVLAAGMRRAGCDLFPSRTGRLPLRRFRQEYGYLAAAAAVSTGSFLIGQAMAAGLGEGSVSILNYGTRLTAVILSIGPAALGVTVLPRFADLVTRRDGTELRRSLSQMLTVCAAVSAALSALLIHFSTPIVRLTLQHGAFTAADTTAVATVQQVSLIQVPFIVCTVLLMRTLAALESNRDLLPVSVVALVMNIVLNYGLSVWYGVAGIALATSLSQALLCLILMWFVFRGNGRRFLLGARA